MRETISLRALLGVVFLCAGSALAQESADVIFYNAKVVTVNDKFSIAEAIAVRNDKIAAVGKNEDVLKLAGPKTLRVDLKGKTVIPGLIDTHSHVDGYAMGDYGGMLTAQQLREYPLNFKLVKSKDDVLKQIRDTLTALRPKPGEWIYFESGGVSTAEQMRILYNEINRWELDKVSPNNPIALTMAVPIGNGYLVNGKAIDILWSKYGSFIEKYGRYWVDAQGRPDGHLEPPANRFVMNEFRPRAAAEDLAPVYNKKLEEWTAMGVTTVSTRLPEEGVAAYSFLESKGQLKLRIAYGAEWGFGDPDPDGVLKGIKVGSGSDMVWMNSLTLRGVDGSGARNCTDLKRDNTAENAISPQAEWYPRGQCHLDIEYRGAAGKGAPIRANYHKEFLQAMARNDVRFANTHVAGDGAASRLLSVMEEINREHPLVGRRWTMDHCTLINPSDIPRGVKLGLMWSCAPKYIANSVALSKAYGEQVTNRFVVPVKSMLAAGVKVAFEMDQDNYIWEDLELLITRQVNGKVWGADERVDRVTALKMITNTAAEYLFREGRLGSLETGKLADLLVLDRDYMSIPETEISEIQPMITMLGGKMVYVHPQFAAQYTLRPEGAVISTYKELRERHVRGQLSGSE